MAIDYIVGRRCKVKATLGEYFLTLVKQKTRVESYGYLLEMNASSGETPCLNEDIREQGLEVHGFLENQLKPLEQWGGYCGTCPANMNGRVGGCWNFLPYPIPSLVERLLLTTSLVLIKEKGEVLGKPFVLDLLETGEQGNLMSYLRKNRLTDLSESLQETWGLPLKRSTIKSDWILQSILGQNLKGSKLERTTRFLEHFQKSSQEGLNKAKNDHKGVKSQYHHFRFQLLPYWDFIKACQLASELKEEVEIYVS